MLYFPLSFSAASWHNASMEIRNAIVIERAMRKYAQCRTPLQQWIRIIAEGSWNNLIKMRKTFPAADAIKGTSFTCFNIGGNNFRLIASVSYAGQFVVVKEILTHAEYDKKY